MVDSQISYEKMEEERFCLIQIANEISVINEN